MGKKHKQTSFYTFMNDHYEHKKEKEIKDKDNTLASRVTSSCDVLLSITHDARNKIDTLVSHFDTEVAWLGGVSYDDGIFTIEDITVPEQEASETDVIITGEGYARAIANFKKRGLMTKYHGHSHVDMEAYFSITDHDLYKSIAYESWIFAGVYNKKGDSKHGLFMQRTLHGKCIVEMFDDTLELMHENNPIDESYIKSIEDKVKVAHKPLYDDSWGMHRGVDEDKDATTKHKRKECRTCGHLYHVDNVWCPVCLKGGSYER